jgi:DNA repair exonuclease SbcCD ATPase subunit
LQQQITEKQQALDALRDSITRLTQQQTELSEQLGRLRTATEAKDGEQDVEIERLKEGYARIEQEKREELERMDTKPQCGSVRLPPAPDSIGIANLKSEPQISEMEQAEDIAYD